MANDVKTVNENGNQAKISGYLEKKGKMRMVSSWKKYWFVLEGRLLLYYRSRSEYDTLSPCKGSVTLGPSCNIKPTLASNCVFQIETRTNTVTLRAENRYEQDKWMQAVLGALNQSSSNPAKLSHFRYSADDLVRQRHTTTDKIAPQEETLEEELVVNNTSSQKLNETNTLNAEIHKEPAPEAQKQEEEDAKNAKEEIEDKEITIENSIYDKTKTLSHPEEPITSIDGELTGSEIKSHIYQEIDDTDTELNEIPPKKEEEEEKIYDMPGTDRQKPKELKESNDLLEPQLPPRSVINVHDEQQPAVQPIDKIDKIDKKMKEVRVKHLAKLVKENRKDCGKDSTKRQSFVARVFNKIRRQDNNVDNINMDNINIDNIKIDNSKEESGEDLGTKDDTLAIDEEIVNNVFDENNVTIGSKGIEEDVEGGGGRKPKEQEDERRTPELPMKQKYLTEYTYDLYNLENRLNIPRPKLIIKSKKSKTMVQQNIIIKTEEYVEETPLQTIDEILDDLDSQSQSLHMTYEPFSRQKVKELIEKFNEEEEFENNLVRLRRPSKEQKQIQSKSQSDDLSFLLEELTKVTNAPVLPPGVTTSLVDTSSHTDVEWKILVPERKRRYSEPDYDIPRPHSSLQITQNDEKKREMEPTRFLGPVLMDQNGNTSCTANSITPDSLEFDQNCNNERSNFTSSVIEEEDRSMRSYTSHVYRLPSKKQQARDLEQIEIDIKPDVIIKQSKHGHYNDINSNRSTLEFQDSLEPIYR